MTQTCTEGLSLTRYTIWLILTQFGVHNGLNVRWSWNELPATLFAITSLKILLKFWHNMGTYSSHFWCEFQQAATLLCKLLCFLCVFFEMVLKGPTEYTICDNFTNTRVTELKFWHNVDTYSGHLCCEFQQAATSTVEVTTLFVCFLKMHQICS